MNAEERMRAAAEHIVTADPAFAPIVAAAPQCPLVIGEPNVDSHFATLVKSVVAQQLSTKAADTIEARLSVAAGQQLTPTRILALDVAEMRAAGLSRAKVRTLHGLAQAFHHNDWERQLALLPDRAIVAELTALWGIGRWTVEMFLMFALHRLDVWPVGDLAMRRGWELLHNLAAPIRPGDLDELGEPLAPYRSVAAWYCWRVSDADNTSWD